ncbi:hypothetical protein H7170_03675 [Candidatus Gracilibacteria bacterium]|nr:hypothetical protein [Candidatus Gracilibacteria bacterium]
MQETPTSIIREPSQFAWFASLSLLTLTLVSCLALWGYHFVTASRLVTLTVETQAIDADIATSTKDRDIIIADILASAQIRPSIDLKALVRSFRVAATQAGVRFQGFSVHDDVISSSLIASRDVTSMIDPVETIIAMMRSDSTTSGLALQPIRSVQGSNTERTTGILLRILPTNSATHAIK